MDKKIKLFNEFLLKNASVNSRRHFLKNCTLGMGGIALSNFLSACNSENNLFKNNSSLNPLAPASPPDAAHGQANRGFPPAAGRGPGAAAP